MFKSAMKELFNLIDNATVQPVGGINMLLGHPEEIEFVRGCFRDLFADDGGDLTVRQARIIDFMNSRTPASSAMPRTAGNTRRR